MIRLERYITEKFRLRDDTVIREQNFKSFFDKNLNNRSYLQNEYSLFIQLIDVETKDTSTHCAMILPMNLLSIDSNDVIEYDSLSIDDGKKLRGKLTGLTKLAIDNYMYGEITSLFQIFIPHDDAVDFLNAIKKYGTFSPGRLVHGTYATPEDMIRDVFINKHDDTKICAYRKLEGIDDEDIDKFIEIFKK